MTSEGTPEALQQAAKLYTGDLLSGFPLDEAPFEEWLVGARGRPGELALEALARLGAHQRNTGSLEEAVRTALKLLGLDPLQEAVHRILMRLYADLGRRGAALRQYRQCVAVLQRDLEIEPEAETALLYEEILRRRPEPLDVDETHVALGSPSLQANDPRLHDLPVPRSRLIGREEELATAEQLLLRSDVGLVTLTGAGGTGKTRFALQIAADLADRFRDGVFFVTLAPIGDPGLVPSTIARALGIQDVGRRPPLESV